MERVELSPFDKKDLLELLDYADKKKELERPDNTKMQHWDDYGFWHLRIEQLKMILNGKQVNESYIKSSYETIDQEMNQIDKQKYRYKKSLESEIFNVFNDKKEE